MLRLEIGSRKFGKLIESLKMKNEKSVVFSFEKPEVKLEEISAGLWSAIDYCILKGIEVRVENVPYCFLVGYKRYIKEKEDSRKVKAEKCGECGHSGKCSGLWKAYVEKFGEGGIIPVSGNYIITDNERCMVAILLEKGKATTRELLELKNSPEFKDLCAHCVGSDDVMFTGSRMIEKGVAKRAFLKEGYTWSINREHPLVKNIAGVLE